MHGQRRPSTINMCVCVWACVGEGVGVAEDGKVCVGVGVG